MPEEAHGLALLGILIGAIVVVALLLKVGMRALRLPPLVGYLLLGFAINAADGRLGFLPSGASAVFEFLALLGIVALLFAVGARSDFKGLRGQLGNAGPVLLGNVVVSGGLGFGAAWLLGAGTIPCLVVAVALSATSVGVPSRVYQATGALETPNGQLFVDVAELDDIAGVVLLVILFGVLGDLRDAGIAGLLTLDAAATAGFALLKLAALAAGCYVFAHFAEKPIVRYLGEHEGDCDTTLTAAGIGVILAGIAGLLGFSAAIGAFFAGLAFSSDRKAVVDTDAYRGLQDALVPFFFIGIGLSVDPGILGDALVPGLVLAAAAIAGKFLGTAGPALLVAPPAAATTLGVAMIPRAEVTLVLADRAAQRGAWALPDAFFSALVLTSLATCVLAPPVLRALLLRNDDAGTSAQPRGGA